MNIYRYTNYDFEKDYLPVGFEQKEPQVFSESAPDKDYILYDNEDYLVSFLKEKYILNAENGSDYVYVITAKIKNLIPPSTPCPPKYLVPWRVEQ